MRNNEQEFLDFLLLHARGHMKGPETYNYEASRSSLLPINENNFVRSVAYWNHWRYCLLPFIYCVFKWSPLVVKNCKSTHQMNGMLISHSIPLTWANRTLQIQSSHSAGPSYFHQPALSMLSMQEKNLRNRCTVPFLTLQSPCCSP